MFRPNTFPPALLPNRIPECVLVQFSGHLSALMPGIALDPTGGSRLGVLPRCQLVRSASRDAFETVLALWQWRLGPTGTVRVLYPAVLASVCTHSMARV